MLHCKPDLTPRQMLWGLSSECADIGSALSEVCVYDTQLFMLPETREALNALTDARNAIYKLRCRASAETIETLSANIITVDDFISKLF